MSTLHVQVADIQLQSSRLEVQNSDLKLQLEQCQSNFSHTTDESRRRLQDNQQTHDRQVGVCSCLSTCLSAFLSVTLLVTHLQDLMIMHGFKGLSIRNCRQTCELLVVNNGLYIPWLELISISRWVRPRNIPFSHNVCLFLSQVEVLLLEQNSLREEKNQQVKQLSNKENEVQRLNTKVQTLTAAQANCKVRARHVRSVRQSRFHGHSSAVRVTGCS